MNEWFVLALLASSTGLLLWSVRELARWYFRINILEDKIDYLHKMLVRIEDKLEIDRFEINPPEERKNKHSLFLLKERTENNPPQLLQ